MSDGFSVAVTAGSLRSTAEGSWTRPHAWTEEGVAVEADFNGAHLYLLTVAGCVLNDCYREAQRLGVPLEGVRVDAAGGFDDGWASTGVDYRVTLDTTATPQEADALLAAVDEVAEMPQALRRGATVERVRT